MMDARTQAYIPRSLDKECLVVDKECFVIKLTGGGDASGTYGDCLRIDADTCTAYRTTGQVYRNAILAFIDTNLCVSTHVIARKCVHTRMNYCAYDFTE